MTSLLHQLNVSFQNGPIKIHYIFLRISYKYTVDNLPLLTISLMKWDISRAHFSID